MRRMERSKKHPEGCGSTRKRLNHSGISAENIEQEEVVMVTLWIDQSEKNVLISYEHE